MQRIGKLKLLLLSGLSSSLVFGVTCVTMEDVSQTAITSIKSFITGLVGTGVGNILNNVFPT